MKVTGLPAMICGARPVACTAEAAATKAMVSLPDGAARPAERRAADGRRMRLKNSVRALASATNTPRRPLLPPVASNAYSPDSSLGSAPVAASDSSAACRVSRGSVTT